MEKKNKEISLLEEKMSAPNFWDTPDQAKKIIDQVNLLKGWTEPFKTLQQDFTSAESLLPEAIELKEEELIEELLETLNTVEKQLEELEFKRMLSGPLDGKNCYFTINAGAGGTESCDWALMLLRMYTRWMERKGWNVEEIDQVAGEVAGIKSVTVKVTGAYAFGYCKAERGVHRLVRISPFDSNARRHTSFASVDIAPEIDDDIQVEIRPEHLRIDTYRASGAGGQHVNKTESAVRITHLPTNIVVSCQAERSQLQNRETCMKMLRSKLYEKEMEERKEALRSIGGEKKEIGWGSQIRSYVFQPYTLVKDARTKVEVGDVQAVMNGDLDPFIHAYLKEFGETE